MTDQEIQNEPSQRRHRVNVLGHVLEVLEVRHDSKRVSAPTLVFLHEGLGCIELWRDIPIQLARATGCDALIYDRLGYGHSDPLSSSRHPRDYLEEQAWRHLPALLDRLDERAVIPVGHSDGATIALLFAARCQERTVAAVTEAAHVFVEDVTLGGVRAAVAAYERGDLRKKLMTYHGAKTDQVFHAWANTWLAPEFRDWNIEDCLGHIRSPLLVLQGADDAYGSAAQVEAIRRQAGGPVRAELIEGCGHTPHLEARAQVTRLIANFVDECLRNGSQPP